MEELASLLINLGTPVGLIILALITGTLLEKRHYASIKRREEATRHIPLLNGKEYPEEQPIEEARLVTGSMVVSIDYFKRFLAGLRNIVGGEVRSYESLLDRGRREAILRMKEQLPDANIIVNIRLETSSISKGRKNRMGTTEVLAYGTAIKFADLNEDS